MALASLANPAPRPRDTVLFSSLVDGDILVPDDGFRCMLVGQGHTVRIDPVEGPYVGCHGHARCRHYLDGQLDAGGHVVGMRRYRPAPGAPA